MRDIIREAVQQIENSTALVADLPLASQAAPPDTDDLPISAADAETPH